MDTRADTPRMPSGTPVTVSTGQAAKLVGVSARTVRRWIEKGYLPAQQTARGWLVSPGDLPAASAAARQAEEESHVPDGRSAIRSDDLRATRSERGGQGDTRLDGPAAPHDHPVQQVSHAARQQLEAIRDEWLAPLIAQLRELERENGKLQAERDGLHERLRRYEEASTTHDTKAEPIPDVPQQPWWKRLFGLA